MRQHYGVFDCSERALVNVVERMSARNTRATVHAPRSQRTSTRVSREFSIAMSARNIRATAHAPRSQHVHYPNLKLKTDWFHVVYRPVTPYAIIVPLIDLIEIDGSASFCLSNRCEAVFPL